MNNLENLCFETKSLGKLKILAFIGENALLEKMYNQLAKQQNDAISDYATSLLANNQENTANIINNLMNLAFQGYNVVSGNQAQSLNTSSGNANKNTNSSGSSSSV